MSFKKSVLKAVVPSLIFAGILTLEALTVKIPSFSPGTVIPLEYVYSKCGGQNKSPALQWAEVPEGTKSFALIVNDPDAPRGHFIHWTIFNIPPSSRGLEKNASARGFSDGTVHGINDFKNSRYDGPCPPSGTHRYIFTVYALDKLLDLASGIEETELKKAMDGHILGRAQAHGTYTR